VFDAGAIVRPTSLPEGIEADASSARRISAGAKEGAEASPGTVRRVSPRGPGQAKVSFAGRGDGDGDPTQSPCGADPTSTAPVDGLPRASVVWSSIPGVGEGCGAAAAVPVPSPTLSAREPTVTPARRAVSSMTGTGFTPLPLATAPTASVTRRTGSDATCETGEREPDSRVRSTTSVTDLVTEVGEGAEVVGEGLGALGGGEAVALGGGGVATVGVEGAVTVGVGAVTCPTTAPAVAATSETGPEAFTAALALGTDKIERRKRAPAKTVRRRGACDST
jgi:hypothetical protein